MAAISMLESLLARVRRRAAEPRPARVRPASRVALRSYADVDEDDIEDDDIEEYDDELVEIVDGSLPAPAPVPVRQSPIPVVPATQRSEPPPAPLRAASERPLPSRHASVRPLFPPLAPVPPSVQAPLQPPVPRPPPTWDAVAARAKRSIRSVEPPQSSVSESITGQPVTQASASLSVGQIVARSPTASRVPVAQARGQLPLVEGESFVELLEDSLHLG